MKKSLCFISLVLASQGFVSLLPAPRVRDGEHSDANRLVSATHFPSQPSNVIVLLNEDGTPAELHGSAQAAGVTMGIASAVAEQLKQSPSMLSDLIGGNSQHWGSGAWLPNSAQQRVDHESRAALTYSNGGISEQPSLLALPAPASPEMSPAESSRTTCTNGSASHLVRRSHTTVGQNASSTTKASNKRGKMARGHTMGRGDQKNSGMMRPAELPSERQKRLAAEQLASGSSAGEVRIPSSNGLQSTKRPTLSRPLPAGFPNTQAVVQKTDNDLSVGKMPSIPAASSAGTGAPPPPPPPPGPNSAPKLPTESNSNNVPLGKPTASVNNNAAPKENSLQSAGNQQPAGLMQAIREGVTLKKVEESGKTSWTKRQKERDNGATEGGTASPTSSDQKSKLTKGMAEILQQAIEKRSPAFQGCGSEDEGSETDDEPWSDEEDSSAPSASSTPVPAPPKPLSRSVSSISNASSNKSAEPPVSVAKRPKTTPKSFVEELEAKQAAATPNLSTGAANSQLSIDEQLAARKNQAQSSQDAESPWQKELKRRKSNKAPTVPPKPKKPAQGNAGSNSSASPQDEIASQVV